VARPRRRVPDRPQSSLAPVLGLFTVAYIGIVVLSRMFFDASIPINERIFAPLIVAAREPRDRGARLREASADTARTRDTSSASWAIHRDEPA
jgi:hypothetical protein